MYGPVAIQQLFLLHRPIHLKTPFLEKPSQGIGHKWGQFEAKQVDCNLYYFKTPKTRDGPSKRSLYPNAFTFGITSIEFTLY